MDVLVLIDKLDDLVHNAKAVPLTDTVRVDKEEIYDILDQMRATIPEEIKQARWIVKERQEMLAEAKREAERIVKEARERQEQLVSQQEVTRQAERAAEDIIEDARAREREIRLGAEDYADEILNTLEVNLSKFIAAVQRGRERLQGRDEPAEVGYSGLEVIDLARRYGDRVALDGVSFAVEPGQMFGFVGPNGAGKTTTMRIILGVLERRRAARCRGTARRSTRAAARFGYMPEERGLYPKMRVRPQLVYLASLHGVAARGRRRPLDRAARADRARRGSRRAALARQPAARAARRRAGARAGAAGARRAVLGPGPGRRRRA